MEAAFQVRETDGDGLDALFIGEVRTPTLLDLIHRGPTEALLFVREVHLLQLVVWDLKKVSKYSVIHMDVAPRSIEMNSMFLPSDTRQHFANVIASSFRVNLRSSGLLYHGLG